MTIISMIPSGYDSVELPGRCGELPSYLKMEVDTSVVSGWWYFNYHTPDFIGDKPKVCSMSHLKPDANNVLIWTEVGLKKKHAVPGSPSIPATPLTPYLNTWYFPQTVAGQLAPWTASPGGSYKGAQMKFREHLVAVGDEGNYFAAYFCDDSQSPSTYHASLWIVSRYPKLCTEQKEDILSQLKANGVLTKLSVPITQQAANAMTLAMFEKIFPIVDQDNCPKQFLSAYLASFVTL